MKYAEVTYADKKERLHVPYGTYTVIEGEWAKIMGQPQPLSVRELAAVPARGVSAIVFLDDEPVTAAAVNPQMRAS